MKIAFVSDAIYPYNKGGKEKRLYDVTTRLVTAGHDVHIYCMKWWPGSEKHRVEDGVHLHAISPFYPLYDGQRRSIKQGVMFGLHCLKLLFVRFDVIDVDSMPFFPILFTRIVCWLRFKRMFATWHEVWGHAYWKEYLGSRANLAFIIEWISAQLPDYIISVSPLTTERLHTLLWRYHDITTITNGIDRTRILTIRPSPTKVDVLYAGRLLKHKNVDFILETLDILRRQGKKVTATIVGDGPEKENLKKLARELTVDKNVEFIDFLPSHDDVIARMKSANIFVLPSEREGFGLVAIEANACGIPFATYNSPTNATAYLTDMANGWVFRNNSHLARLIDRAIELNKHHVRGRTIAKGYDWNNIIDRLVKYYQS